MEIVAQWVQQRVERGGAFSSALFCLWLSLASLVPLLDLPAPPPQTAPVVQAQEAPLVAHPT